MPVQLSQALSSVIFPTIIKSHRKTNMKKPTLQIQEQQPRNIQRADIAPVNGFALVVDGHFKTEFGSETAAQEAAKELLTKFPKLQVSIYDASTKKRSLILQQTDLL
jgi:hypothetical protein